MRLSVINIIEMIIGAFLIGAGLLYLSSQVTAAQRLSDTVSDAVLKEGELYQKYQKVNINQISEEQLYAVIIGYREYPIMIDQAVMSADQTDCERYINLVRDGYYKKDYEYDSDHNIVKVIYTYIS